MSRLRPPALRSMRKRGALLSDRAHEGLDEACSSQERLVRRPNDAALALAWPSMGPRAARRPFRLNCDRVRAPLARRATTSQRKGRSSASMHLRSNPPSGGVETSQSDRSIALHRWLNQRSGGPQPRRFASCKPMRAKARIALASCREANAPPFPAVVRECERHREERGLEGCQNHQ